MRLMKKLLQNFLLALGICTWFSLAVHGAKLTTPANADTSIREGSPSITQGDGQPIGVNPMAKNVIFLIGDGMGLAHVSGAIASSSEPLALQRAQAIGLIGTSSASHFVTDSAAAGTALSSGKKTVNGVIGQNSEGEAIPSMLAYAIQVGKSTGVVVTSSITHATPASFYAHNKTRRDEVGIAKDLLDAKLDVAIGGGRKFFEERADGLVLTDQLKANGYAIAYSIDEVLSAPEGSRLVGLLADVALPKANEGRGPVLAQATAKALELLSANPDGFMLIVEGSQIDWGGHRNDWDYVLTELLDFDATIKVAMDYADANPDTLIVITADHETGGLSLVGGDLAEHAVTPHWALKSHTGIMVPVYAYGAGSDGFTGIYENTEVFDRILKALGISKENVPAVRNSMSLTDQTDLSSPGASIGMP